MKTIATPCLPSPLLCSVLAYGEYGRVTGCLEERKVFINKNKVMSTKLKIKVTKEILERSKMCGVSPDESGEWLETMENCAIALAIRDIFPKAAVGQAIIYTRMRGATIPLPGVAINFISLFDELDPAARVHMPELEFEIDIPDKVIEQIDIEAIRPLLINHPTLELV